MAIYSDAVKKMVERAMKERDASGETLDLSRKQNLVQQFRATVRRFPDAPALRSRRVNDQGMVNWTTKTYSQFLAAVEEIAAALLDAGVKPGDAVNIQCHTREEWAIIDEAVIGIGAVLVCNYPSLAPAVVEYQLNDSKSIVAFVETREHVDTLVKLKPAVPSLVLAIAIDDPLTPLPPWMTTLDAFAAKGRALLADKPALREEIATFEHRVDPGDLATVVYTSGTTGMPKGAMLTHWNIASDCLMVRWFCAMSLSGKTNLSFLPLSHSFERMAGHYYPIMEGMCTAFASDLENLSRDLQEIRPEYLTGVPRVFEKIYAFAMQSIQEYPPSKRKVFEWAVTVGKAFDTLFRANKPAPLGLRLKLAIARKLVFDKILAKTGGRVLFFVSGGASLSTELARFYGAVGLVIIEGYGLTETSPVTNMNDPLDIVYGTVGPPLPGTEERLGEGGEILIKGPQVFKGYLNKPEQTAAVLDGDGWFATGDIGEFDERGNLKIVGRKKEIFVMSTGKKVPPLVVEGLAATTRFIQQLVLQGDGEKFISALLTPNMAALASHVKRELPDLASDVPPPGAPASEIEAFLAKPAIVALFQEDVDAINEQVDPFMQIKRFVILPHELSEETGDLTPSLKFKRAAITGHYRDRIQAMYS